MDRPDEKWFQERLEAFLRERHPQKNLRSLALARRSRLAAEKYLTSLGCGQGPEQALRRADKILFGGLLFSPYDTVRLILETDYPAIEECRRHNVTLALLRRCRSIFRTYDLGDDFAERPEFRRLKEKLRLGIRNWIDESGVPGYRSPTSQAASPMPYSRRPKYVKRKKRI